MLLEMARKRAFWHCATILRASFRRRYVSRLLVTEGKLTALSSRAMLVLTNNSIREYPRIPSFILVLWRWPKLAIPEPARVLPRHPLDRRIVSRLPY